MQPKTKELLFEILAIIRYTKNKDKFVQEFEAMNHLEAITNLLEKFPMDLREKIKMRFLNKEHTVIKEYISSEEYVDEVMQIEEKELKAFIDVMLPILTFDQRQKIHQLTRN